MMNKNRKFFKFASILALSGIVFLATAQASHADVVVQVTKSSFTSPITHPGTIVVPFSANVTGLPTANSECTVTGPTYSWVLTVAGHTESYTSTSANATVSHNTNGVNGCGTGTITVTAVCTITYSTSAGCVECGAQSSVTKSGSDSATVQVNGDCSQF